MSVRAAASKPAVTRTLRGASHSVLRRGGGDNAAHCAAAARNASAALTSASSRWPNSALRAAASKPAVTRTLRGASHSVLRSGGTMQRIALLLARNASAALTSASSRWPNSALRAAASKPAVTRTLRGASHSVLRSGGGGGQCSALCCSLSHRNASAALTSASSRWPNSALRAAASKPAVTLHAAGSITFCNKMGGGWTMQRIAPPARMRALPSPRHRAAGRTAPCALQHRSQR